MPSRTSQRRESARQVRLALEQAERVARTQRRRRNAGLVTIVVAVLIVGFAVASSGHTSRATAATGAHVADASYSAALLAGIPQHGLVLGSPNAPVRVIEFADLQCPYCDEFSTQALPQLVTQYVRTGKVSIEFRNLSFIGPGSLRAGLVAAGAAQQDKLWNFVDLMYLNQGEENSGYVTPTYLHRLLTAIPGLNASAAERASRTPEAAGSLNAATAAATASGVNATPSFLIARAGHPAHLFQPASLTAGAFTGEFNHLLGGRP